jgi:hypothetical protein
MKRQRVVVTSHIYPPIPIRDNDWLACFDGDEEDGPQGWGSTEQKAIDDLVDNYELEEDEEIVLPIKNGVPPVD